MEARALTGRAMAAYSDLLRSLLDDDLGEMRGKPQRVERAGRAYWYDAYRLGGASKKRYLGEENDALPGSGTGGGSPPTAPSDASAARSS